MLLHDHTTVTALFKRAMADGGTREGLTRITWNVEGDCSDAVSREFHGRPASPGDGREIVIAPGTNIPLTVTVEVRCRKCPHCLRYRTRVWAARAMYEYRASVRTWLGTFTFRPEEHDRILNLERHQYAQNNQDFDLLTEDQQFQSRHRRCSKFLTLWAKRVRKNSAARLRYLLVLESHKSGLPHYHALVHEPENKGVTKRVLEAAWPHGFTNFRLIEDGERWGPTYACKYLNKSARARVRASQRYGGTVHDLNQ